MTGADGDRLIAGLGADLGAGVGRAQVEAYARFAIRTRSPLALEVLRAAGQGGQVGRVVALSGALDAHRRGVAVLDEVVADAGVGSLPPEVVGVWADLLLRSGRDADVWALVEDPDIALAGIDRWKLRTDLLNPYRTTWDGGGAPVVAGEALERAERAWLRVLNEAFSPDGLEPLGLGPAQVGDSPYQRLQAPVAGHVDGDLVTVVMSAYQPTRDLLLAVRGVLQQTWRNLELLIVDDASPPGSQGVLQEAEGLDPRVRVVRASGNRGTYEARNLALSIAQGRWMTFQDSDDWTHPRRVEHQVGHLVDSPRVLANRTRTLRAYPDVTMTFVGYAPDRLNISSLLFDRVRVSRLLGGFDPTRKAADTELPERLDAVRPGSVQDLTQPAPLAVTQLRAGSLSRSDMLPGWARWDRLAYRDSYREWHQQIRSGRSSPLLSAARGRPFPLPRPSWEPDRASDPEPLAWDVIVLGDLRRKGHSARRALGVARTSAQAGLCTAVAQVEAPYPLSPRKPTLLAELISDVRLGHFGRTDVHEDDECDLLVITEPASVLHIDAAALQPRTILIVADDPTPTGWSVAAVEQHCLDLFGITPIWGGPTRVHDTPQGPSAVRLAVPDQRWCTDDLAAVVGDGWHLVGSPTAPRPLQRRHVGASVRATVVVGHHLDDESGRWPTSADDFQAAYPTQLTLRDDAGDGAIAVLPVELHGLWGLKAPIAVMGHPMHPSSWVSFAKTPMTVREFLSHIDVWVYYGEWDTAAEVAALEALDAGLPCILTEDAAISSLDGPVRCVPAAQAQQAMEELLTQAGAESHSFAGRQDEWERALHRLMTTAEPAPTRPRESGHVAR